MESLVWDIKQGEKSNIKDISAQNVTEKENSISSSNDSA